MTASALPALPEDLDPLTAALALDVAAGFARTPKTIPPRWLYDDLGSSLFEAICHLPWYRITRAERALLEQHGDAIVEAFAGSEILELGGGNGEKLDLLLDAFTRRGRAVDVRLIDISSAALDAARVRLESRPSVRNVLVTRGAYERALSSLPASGTRLALFLGSNIGNFDPPQARTLLEQLRVAAGDGGAVLLGVDLVKPEQELLLAYDDPLHVTAAFNRNLLARINRELGASIPLEAFAHRAVWNRHASRMEMHLVALRDVQVRVPLAGVETWMSEGESIWTESSYKYVTETIAALAKGAGLDVTSQWVEPSARFALSLLRSNDRP